MDSEAQGRITVEREVKVACPENLLIGRRDLEMELVEPRHFEDNWLLDFDDRRLTSSDRVLRLRIVDEQGWLTYKSAPLEHPWLKAREEIQVALDAPRTMLTLIEAIGLKPVFRYQKRRTHYRVRLAGGSTVDAMFDETPMGNFLELEGETEAIADLIDRLGLSPQDLIQSSYPALWAQQCQTRGEAIRDMVFATDQMKEEPGDTCEP